jgi:hypothetical protein
MQTHQFQLAGLEWERVLFLNPADTLARLSQLKSFRLGNQPAAAWQKFNHWYADGSISRPFSLEAMQLTLMQKDFPSFRSVLGRSSGLTDAEISNYQLGAWLLEGDWINQPVRSRAPSFSLVAADPGLTELYGKASDIRRKSPAAAVTLSAIVPGLGKIYSNDWKDGLLSLLFVATNAWQSYRGFSRKGVTSVSGWIFGSLAAGFYSANLFGSWKSANVYNEKQVDLIRHDTEDILYTR